MNKTKQIGDKVFILEDNKIKEGTIKRIDYEISFYKKYDNGNAGEYTTYRQADSIFGSKEELIESLIK